MTDSVEYEWKWLRILLMAFLNVCCYTSLMKNVAQNAFPPLKPAERNREFDLYSEEQRSSVIFYWLFTRYGFRELDEICLNLNGKTSHGYQSMGIAHFLGLCEAHKAFFYGRTIPDALNSLQLSVRNPKLMLIYWYKAWDGRKRSCRRE